MGKSGDMHIFLGMGATKIEFLLLLLLPLIMPALPFLCGKLLGVVGAMSGVEDCCCCLIVIDILEKDGVGLIGWGLKVEFGEEELGADALEEAAVEGLISVRVLIVVVVVL